MFTLVWTSSFTHSANKFIKNYSDLREKFTSVLCELETDPFQPHLKYHHLDGNLNGVQAVSITYKFPITITIIVSESEIILLDVGSRDEVYR